MPDLVRLGNSNKNDLPFPKNVRDPVLFLRSKLLITYKGSAF